MSKYFRFSKKTKTIKTNLLILISVSALSLLAVPTLYAKEEAQKEKPTTYLFVQTAAKAKIELNKKVPNTYIVTLKQVNPFVTYFTDRPRRIASSMPIDRFLKIWDSEGKDSFKRDAPNVDFNGIQVGFLSPDKPLNLVLELSDPVYDSKTRTLTYTAKPLEGNSGPIPDSVSVDHAVLFIDDACLSCW